MGTEQKQKKDFYDSGERIQVVQFGNIPRSMNEICFEQGIPKFRSDSLSRDFISKIS